MAERIRRTAQPVEEDIDMSLIDSFRTSFTRLVRTAERDSAGHIVYSYFDGESFSAALVLSGSSEKETAGNVKAVSSYTLTADEDVVIEYADILRRESDGRLFRVTGFVSEEPPATASFSFRQYSAEDFDSDGQEGDNQ